MLSVSSGHSAEYLTSAVGSGRENYYTGAVTEGEPPGQWFGDGAQALGLDGEVDADVMHHVYGRYADPRDERFADPGTRDQAGRLGRAPKTFRSPEQVAEARVEAYLQEHRVHPAPEQVQAWTVEAEKAQPRAVMFYDLTFSVPKSVSVLWAANARAATDAREAGDLERAERMQQRADLIEDAISQANRVMLAHVQDNTLSRVGRHGGSSSRQPAGDKATGRWVNVEGITVASFPQHTSRERDPQLHTHNALLNRVECADGEFRAVDGKSLFAVKAGAAAIAGMELREQLSRDLGVEWVMREDGNDFEIEGITAEEMAALSSRGRTLTARAEDLIAEFEEHHQREATGWEINRLRQAATLETRPGKRHDGETHAEMLDRADAAMRGEVAGGLGLIADRMDRRTNTDQTDGQSDGQDEVRAGAGEWSPHTVIAQAVEACHGERGRATFNRAELSRQIALTLPARLGLQESGQARELIEQLTDQALADEAVIQTSGREIGTVPAEHRLADGRAATIGPDAVRFAARGHIAAEHALMRAAGVRGRTHAGRDAVRDWLDGEAAASLNPAQREAVAGLASSDAALAVLIGPAGTGKSYTVGALSQAWGDLTGGRVVGVATAQVAADVLRDDGLPDAANTRAFLTAQDRFASGKAMPDDARWHLGGGDILVVDEASMVDTHTLTRLQQTVDDAGARMVLLGDPRQLGAVGAGGMMRTLTSPATSAGQDGEGAAAEVYSLGEVRRFTAQWEREASLRLRDGDDTVATEYDRRGRIVESGTEADTVAAVARAAAADRIGGRDCVVVTGSNRLAAEVSAEVRRHLVAAGQVQEDGVQLGRDGCTAGVGDLVQARRIDRGLGLTNRETYTVLAVREDGGLDVASVRTGQALTMPPAYVEQDAALAYAGTAHATQGATVDVGHVVLEPGMNPAAAYVGLTRGREANTAWAVTDSGIPEQPILTGRGLLASVAAETGDPGDLSALDTAARDDAWRGSAQTLLGLVEDHARIACRGRLDRDLDQLVADGLLDDTQRARFGADQGSEHLARQLRALEQAGHDPAAVLRDAVTEHRLDTATSAAQVVSSRIDRQHGLPVPASEAEAPERLLASDTAYLGELGKLLDARRVELGHEAAQNPPAWAITALGQPPNAEDQAAARAEWEGRAGVIAAHREATGWDSPDVAIGRAPGVHTPEKRADWHTAYTAAGMPEERRPEAELSEGRLLVRAAAAERAERAAPAFVDEAMRAEYLGAAADSRDAILTSAAGELDEAAELDEQAREQQQRADRLAAVAEERARYLSAHAETYRAGEAARAELTRRGVVGHEPDRTTAPEWLAADQQARQEDDAHRPITETDLHDHEVATRAPEPSDLTQAVEVRRRPPLATGDQTSPSKDTDQQGASTPAMLSAGASAAHVAAAISHSAAVSDRLDDQASQDASEPTDDWDDGIHVGDAASDHATDHAADHDDDSAEAGFTPDDDTAGSA